MRQLAVGLIFVGVAASTALASDASTTRVEPRPFYGAIVSVESGVRVFRALPPHRNIIIAPEDGPGVNLSINDTRKTVTRDGDDGRYGRRYHDGRRYYDHRD